MGKNLDIQTFYPQNPVLKKHIEYYFLKTEAAEFSNAYYAFSNVCQSLNIHKNTMIENFLKSRDRKFLIANQLDLNVAG